VDGDGPPLSFRWNEIANLTLQGTRTQSGFFWHTDWRQIVVTVNGFEESPFCLNIKGSDRPPKEVFALVNLTWKSFRNGRIIPSIDRLFPQLSQALERLPLEITIPRANSIRGLAAGLVIFLFLFLIPVIAFGVAELAVSLTCLSLFGVVGLVMILRYGLRLVDRSPRLLLMDGGLSYRRFFKQSFIAGPEISEVKFKARHILQIALKSGQRNRPIQLDLRGLNRAPHEIFYLVKHLHAKFWAQAGVKHPISSRPCPEAGSPG